MRQEYDWPRAIAGSCGGDLNGGCFRFLSRLTEKGRRNRTSEFEIINANPTNITLKRPMTSDDSDNDGGLSLSLAKLYKALPFTDVQEYEGQIEDKGDKIGNYWEPIGKVTDDPEPERSKLHRPKRILQLCAKLTNAITKRYSWNWLTVDWHLE